MLAKKENVVESLNYKDNKFYVEYTGNLKKRNKNHDQEFVVLFLVLCTIYNLCLAENLKRNLK